MRAVVVYESMFGNTHRVADAIGAGLTPIFEVSVMPVTQADPAQVKDADLIVVGGPTHVHGMTRAATREAAAKKAADPASATLLEPDAPRQDLRSWLDALGKSKLHGKAAAFDTRLSGPSAVTGRASKRVGKALRHQGYELIAEPESFLVTKEDALGVGEADRARTWGAMLAKSMSTDRGR